MKIIAVLFDLYGTLAGFEPSRFSLQSKVAKKYGYELVDHKLELYGVKKKS